MLKVLVGAAAMAAIVAGGVFVASAYQSNSDERAAIEHAKTVRGCLAAESSGKAPTLTKFCRDSGYLVASR